jgi:hypothetical protein
MGRLRRLALALAPLACAGCPARAMDSPPREETPELASAAPRAVGALAGGTDAAPPAIFAPRPPEDPDGLGIPDLEADAGIEMPDAASGADELPL